jgi:LysM repeat protein
MATVLIKSGDTLSALAQKYGVTISELMKLNPQIKNANLIYAGDNLNIPDSFDTGAAEPPEVVERPAATGTPTVFSSAHFRGDGALIKFSTDPDGSGPMNTTTVWYVDKATNTIRPIMSSNAFTVAFGMPVGEAASQGMISTVPISFLNTSQPLSGFRLLTDAEGIKDDGTYTTLNTGASASGTGTTGYGRTIDNDLNKKVFQIVDGFLTILKSDPKSGISSVTIDNVSKDNSTLATYIMAAANGGYSLADIYRDLKRRELVSSGRTDLASLKVIDPTLSANEYYNTTEGSLARTSADLTPPTWLANIDMGLMNNPVYSIPDELYNVLVPPIDFTTAEGKAEMEAVKSDYHDALLQQIQAKTIQEKRLADTAMEQFLKDTARKYGIQLSNNSLEAWEQLRQLFESMNSRGLSSSGMENEAVDRYLKSVRRADSLIREAQIDEETKQKISNLLKYGSEDEINKMSLEDRTKYGFVVDKDTLAYFDLANLKKLYPDASEADLKLYRDTMIDKNGNFRSQLYQTQFQNKFLVNKGSQWGSMTEGKEDYQQRIAQERKLAAEKKAYEEFTTGDPFSKPPVTDTPQDAHTDYVPGSSSTNIYVSPGQSYDFAARLAGFADAAAARVAGMTFSDFTQGTVQPITSSTTNTTNTNISSSTFTPPAGYVRVPDVASLVNYSSTIKDPNSVAIYGIPKTTKTTAYTPPAGYEAIAHPSLIPNYQGGNTISNNGTLYGIPKTPTSYNIGTSATSNAVASSPSTAPKVTSVAPTIGTSTPASSSYAGASIVDYLKSVNKDSSYTSRSGLASQYGISGYTGTAQQNTDLLKKLRGY